MAFLLAGTCQAELVLPSGYYNEELRPLELSEIVQLIDTVPFVLNAEDCSIRSAFLECALENAGIETEFCYKPLKTNAEGQKVYHIWLKAEEDGGYCYIDTEPRYPDSIIRPDSQFWSWYDSAHDECNDLPAMSRAFESIDNTFDTRTEFEWWIYPKMRTLEFNLER